MVPSVRNLIDYDVQHAAGAGSSMEEKLFLYGLLAQKKLETVLEIGVSRGHMTAWLALAQYQSGGRLRSVDNWSRAHGGEATDHSWAARRLAANGLLDVVDFTAGDSIAFLKQQPDNSFDMVWVDGDHSYEGALADIREAMRVARKVVGVHDTKQSYDGPRDACIKVEEEYGLTHCFWVEGTRGIWLANLEDIE